MYNVSGIAVYSIDRKTAQKLESQDIEPIATDLLQVERFQDDQVNFGKNF